MALGVVGAARILPTVLRELEDASAAQLLVVTVGTFLGAAFVGQAIGLLIGGRLHLALPGSGGRQADRLAGSAVGVLGVVLSVWILLPLMADVPGWMASQARTSTVAREVSDRLPPPPDTVETLRRLLGDDQFPRVFDALEPAPDVGPPPAASALSEATVEAVVPSTVKVSGEACRRIQVGSGFVVAADLVVTNAHVVAGESDTTVERSDGSEVRGRVVAFDPDRDLAILRVPGLDRPALPRAARRSAAWARCSGIRAAGRSGWRRSPSAMR